MGRSRYLCIDCGLTAMKAAVFDDEGSQLAEATADTPLRAEGEASEIDMDAHGSWRHVSFARR